MKIALHTGFRSAQKVVAQRPPALAQPAKPIGKRALRDRLPSVAPKKTGLPAFGGKAAPLFGVKAGAI